ncbi:MAG: hypothetical protein Q9214_002320 [Letrouitia sp. 1 TL-2023]
MEITKREATYSSIKGDVLPTWALRSGQTQYPRRYDDSSPIRSFCLSKIIQENGMDHYLTDTPPQLFSPPPPGDITFEQGNQRLRPPSSDMSWSGVASSKCKSCGSRYSLPCILALLPRYEVCEKLCGIFSSTVFPLMPVLHLLDFSHNFRAFWEETGPVIGHDANIGSLLRRKPSFICLLSSILFASLVTASPSRVADIKDLDDDQSVTPDKMYFAAMVSAMLTGFPRRPSLDTLAAYLIVQSQFVREEDFADAPDFISTAFRVALGMGLHRQLPHAGFSIAELETRRRLWWYILHLDIMSSASSGLSPLFIDDKMANAEMISQYEQHDSNLEDRSNQSWSQVKLPCS